MTSSDVPSGFADADRARRHLKAQKIAALLGGANALRGRKLLDLGAGSGFLSQYFADLGADVTAADRDAHGFAADGIPFHAIDGTRLPFDDNPFDVIVFNHVIEHVGERVQQAAMLGEIARVLRADGVLYLAVPNRWALIEPHYRLPLLGALPSGVADTMVRRFRDHDRYDCRPFGRSELLALVGRHFGEVEERSVDAFHWAIQHEVEGAAQTVLQALPKSVARLANGIFPTLILTARRPRP